MKRILILVMILIIMVGCVQSYEVEEQKEEVIQEEKKEITQEDIIKEFEPLFRLSEEEDFSYLYEENYSFVDKFNPSEDIDLITISCNRTIPESEDILFAYFHMLTSYDVSTNQKSSKAFLKDNLLETKIEYETIINYNNGEYEFKNMDMANDAKEMIINEQLFYNYLTLNEEYLKGLELEHWAYNPSLPSYILKYRLDETDVNVQKIKELYPSIDISNANILLELTGNGVIDGNIYSLEVQLKIYNETVNIFRFAINGETEK